MPERTEPRQAPDDQPAEGIDWSREARNLAEAADADRDFYRLAAAAVLEPTVRLAVDFGCGGAGMARAVRELGAANGWPVEVVALDSNPDVLSAAAEVQPEQRFAVASFDDSADRIREVIGGAPDLIWGRGAIHHAADERAALETLVEVVAAGGRLALQEGGLFPSYLPVNLGIGEPSLEFRLNAARHEFVRQRHVLRAPIAMGWPSAMRAVGLVEVRTHQVMVDVPAPLDGRERAHFLRRVAKQVEWAGEYLSADDRAAWTRLVDPDDAAWLGNRDDLFRLEVHSIHLGRRPA